MANDVLQADVLAKEAVTEDLEQNTNLAEAFEMAIQDESKISGTPQK